jgi:hypothetical protein
MKQVVLVAVLAGSLAAGVAARAGDPQAAGAPKQMAPQTKPAAEAAQPAAKKPARPATAADQATGHTEPKTQPESAPPGTAPTGELALGSVRLAKSVKADGKPLPAGTYQIRLTAQEATPNVAGQTEQLERWVEFVQGGQVKGREVVTIVPQSEIDKVQKDAPPRPNGSKVEMLKGGDYYRVWINKAGNHFLIHLPPA